MSDPFPKHRALPGGVDLRSRDGQANAAEKLDPLAELARLVGREDPFRDLFPTRNAGRKAAPADRLPEPPRLPSPQAFDRFAGATPPRGDREPLAHDHRDDFGDPAAAESSAAETAFHTPLGQENRASFRLPALRHESNPFDASEEGSGPGGEHEESGPLNADLWAQGMPEPVTGDFMNFVPPAEDATESRDASRRRTVVVLAAVLALTAGGLGATFLVHGRGAALSSGEPPTIMADSGPAKIQPPDTSNQSTGGDGNTALIEKSASDNVNNAKIVDAPERPVDLAQLPQAAPAVAGQPDDGRVSVTTAPAGTNANAFPEPRKVKTIMIRPDGSLVSGAPVADPQASTASPIPPVGDAAARPATPKSTARAATTPKSAIASTETAAKPKVLHPTPKPKPAPTQTADATADATASTAPSSTGTFAVQLAAPSSEQDAKDVMGRLQKKYASELDGRTPSIRKADKGDKSVYRVRVGNLSQDDARALCTKLQADGGSCFVVHN